MPSIALPANLTLDYTTLGSLPNLATLGLARGLVWLGHGDFGKDHAWARPLLHCDNDSILRHFGKDAARYTVLAQAQSYFVEAPKVISPPLTCPSQHTCRFSATWTPDGGWQPLNSAAPDALAANRTGLSFDATVTGPYRAQVWFKSISWSIHATFRKTLFVKRYPESVVEAESRVFRISLGFPAKANGYFGLQPLNK